MQELLHVIGVPPVRMVSRPHGDFQDQWLLEIEHCDGKTPMEACLHNNYAQCRIRARSMKYLIIEMVGGSVQPQQNLQEHGATQAASRHERARGGPHSGSTQGGPAPVVAAPGGWPRRAACGRSRTSALRQRSGYSARRHTALKRAFQN